MKSKTIKMIRNNKSVNKAKRMTRKAVYAKFGIVFENNKILSPIGFIPELLKEGNDKTGKLVYTFSLLPGTNYFELEIDGKIIVVKGTCCCDCIGCYAKTGRYNCDNVIHSMAVNTYLVNNYPDFVKRCIMAQLEYIGQGEIRIHAAGDLIQKIRKHTLQCGTISQKKIKRLFSGHTQKSKNLKRCLTIYQMQILSSPLFLESVSIMVIAIISSTHILP